MSLSFLLLATGSTLVGQTQPPPPTAPRAPAAPVPLDPEHNMPDPEVPSPEVIDSARAATEKLGAEVVAGRYGAAIERMYPTWKKRMAERMGGMDKLNAKLADQANEMQKMGMSIISFKPQGQPTVHEVSLGRKNIAVNGKLVEIDAFTKWMVIFPTVTRIKLVMQNEPIREMERTGFQVVISDKGKNEWTFIDGSGLKVADLRSLFSNLPEDLKLPQIGGREIKPGEER